MELFSLIGKAALVTGATRGIGQAMAIALAEAGADIVLVQVKRINTPTLLSHHLSLTMHQYRAFELTDDSATLINPPQRRRLKVSAADAILSRLI